MSQFYNPYHFIPVTGKVNGDDTPTEAYDKIKAGESHIRHDRWNSDSLSGRLLCSLTTVTPTMVGAKQHDRENDEPAVIDHYTRYNPLTKTEDLAIPGNSLRGMFSSVAEAISQSSLRVLMDKHHSVRMEMMESYKAIGRLKKMSDGQWQLQPLVLTTHQLNNNGDLNESPLTRLFNKQPLSQCFPAYIGNYKDRGSRGTINCTRLQTYQAKHNESYYYAELEKGLERTTLGGANRFTQYRGLHIKPGGKMLLGQKLLRQDTLLTKAEFEKKSTQERARYTRGILYILGKNDDTPQNKKHEYFIPYPEKAALPPPLPVAVEALEEFDRIAQLRHEISEKEGGAPQPNLPQGYSRTLPRDKEGQFQFLTDGDLVYFNYDEKHHHVTRVSFSAIWRKSTKQSIYDDFRHHSGDNTLPWGDPKRTALTPAEALFGIVENQRNETQRDSRNLASRVRIADAFSPVPLTQLTSTTLRILASPKLPSPSMYYHQQNSGGYVSKEDLTRNSREPSVPNGRKRYLQHDASEVSTLDKQGYYRWQTHVHERKLNKQKVQGKPLSPKQTLYFHIDYEGLSTDELQLLLASITPATSTSARYKPKHAFHHQIGLGKPLGLGSIEVKLVAHFGIDRQQRYQLAGLKQARYNRIEAEDNTTFPENLASRYPLEYSHWQTQSIITPVPRIGQYVDTSSIDSLLTLGDRGALNQQLPICYPYSGKQKPHEETEGFGWFTTNKAHERKRRPNDPQSQSLLWSKEGAPVPLQPNQRNTTQQNPAASAQYLKNMCEATTNADVDKLLLTGLPRFVGNKEKEKLYQETLQALLQLCPNGIEKVSIYGQANGKGSVRGSNAALSTLLQHGATGNLVIRNRTINISLP